MPSKTESICSRRKNETPNEIIKPPVWAVFFCCL
nr:MAG TPA: hypothetical protein [Caudoviricetes sp.]